MAISNEERRIVTVLFADMAGSTALGEGLDPEEMRRLLARYYAIARESVAQHGGTVEKFIGDAVMAVFGLPTAHGDDPDRAMAAALAMRLRIRGDPQLKGRIALRFGVSTGEVVASRDQSAGDFLITGDATNVAARLQQAAEPWAILASDRSVRAAKNFEFGEEIEVTAKGKSVSVAARLVLGPRKAKAQKRVDPPLVGRETELAQLQLVARRTVNEKRPSMVSIIAPAGIGKTRLVEEFLGWLPNLTPNALVATAQCLPYGQQLTYWPMGQVLFTLSGISQDSKPDQLRPQIAAWLRGLGVEGADGNATLLAAAVGEMGAEGLDKDLLFAAWRSALEAIARRTPLVILFEDLHWSSDSLLDLAEFVMQTRGDAAVLMIVLARPELLDRRPNWGGRRLNHLAIALEPLASTAIAELIRHLIDSDEPELIKLVSKRSEGNPFYASELVRSYIEQGSLETLPDTVQATVLARLDLLPRDERRVVQLGSVFGHAFHAAGVAALERGGEEGVQHACDNLAERDLIRPADAGRYDFRHILIQEVAYGTLPRTERARLHAEAAKWVESVSEGREISVAEIIAFHHREAAVLSTALDPLSELTAQRRQMAAKWLLKAADAAAASVATPEAVRHIRASFDFVDAKLLPRLHERIGDLTAGDTGFEEYRIALAGYEQQNVSTNDQLRALSGMLMVSTRWIGSLGERASEVAMNQLRSKGRAMLKLADDQRSIGRFLAADAFFPFWVQIYREPTTDEIVESNSSAEQAIEIATKLDDPELASAALDALASVAVTVFDWSKALEMARRRIAFEERLGLYERLDAHSMLAWMSCTMGDLATAERDSAEVLARLLPGQALFPALHLCSWRALVLFLLGQWNEALVMLDRALEAWNDAGRVSAGHALRGFIVGCEIGRARGDARLVEAASEPILSTLARFPHERAAMRLKNHLSGHGGFTEDDPVRFVRYPPELVERLLSLASDLRENIPSKLLAALLDRSIEQKVPLLEAQVRRAIGLSGRDPSELSAAIAIWEPIGVLPNLGRARAERGMLIGDSAETEAGLAILKQLGDVNYVDRFATHSGRPAVADN
jgi:class 3 adenylate cyclase/tetratricopeptide (TPR) repeat protein